MTNATSTVLPWTLRQRLLLAIRESVVSHGKSKNTALHELVAKAIAAVATKTKNRELQQLVNLGIGGERLSQIIRSWAMVMPSNRRSEWMLERLTEVAHLEWEPEPAPTEGPMTLPARERDLIRKRIERVHEKYATRGDAIAEHVADLVDAELERIAQKNEAFAVRLLSTRFPDSTGTKTLSFRELLDRRELKSAADVLQLLESSLEIVWSPAAGAPSAQDTAAPLREPTVYSPTASFSPGDLVAHPKFGVGTVITVEGGRVKIRFGETERTLARG